MLSKLNRLLLYICCRWGQWCAAQQGNQQDAEFYQNYEGEDLTAEQKGQETGEEREETQGQSGEV